MTKIVNSQKWTQKLLEDIILLPLDLALLFCITFTGDYTIHGIPLFFVFWIIIFVFRRNFRLEKAEILGQIFIVLTFLPILFQFDKYSFAYYCGAYYAILYVNAIVFATHIIDRLLSETLGSKLVRWLPAISLLVLVGLTQILNGGGSRQSLVFGPNIFYRIIGITFLLHLVIFQKDYTSNKSGIWISIASLFITIIFLNIALYVLIKTGSRGATIVGGILLFSFGYSLLFVKKKKLLIIAGIFLLLFINTLMMTSNFSSYFLDSRAFWFYDRGASSGSFQAREGFWGNLPSFFLEDNFLLGEGSNYLYYYPHNLYLDLLYNAGIFPCLILLIFTALYIILFLQGKVYGHWKILTIVMLPIYMGSLVSGTLYDNYSIISMIIMLPIWMLNPVRTSYVTKSRFLQ